MIRVCTQELLGLRWLQRYRGLQPAYICVLGFTETCLIPGISAAGATPEARRYTAIADAEFLHSGTAVHHPLPPLTAGVSPAFIARAAIAQGQLPVWLFNAGLPQPPAVPAIDLGGMPARCLSSGAALPLAVAAKLLEQGLIWGEKLGREYASSYLILSECAVGGTTTALAVLTGLGYAAAGKVNSSHATCNHEQKLALVQAGLSQAEGWQADPLRLAAAVGDPMQIALAGIAIAASRSCGVLLAGGTQMLAVYAWMRAIAEKMNLAWEPEQIAIGTTRWVAEDPTGDTIGLAEMLGAAPLLAAQLNFSPSRYSQLQAYERGFVKEGVGAGGCAIAIHLYQNWQSEQLLAAVEDLVEKAERSEV